MLSTRTSDASTMLLTSFSSIGAIGRFVVVTEVDSTNCNGVVVTSVVSEELESLSVVVLTLAGNGFSFSVVDGVDDDNNVVDCVVGVVNMFGVEGVVMSSVVVSVVEEALDVIEEVASVVDSVVVDIPIVVVDVSIDVVDKTAVVVDIVVELDVLLNDGGPGVRRLIPHSKVKPTS